MTVPCTACSLVNTPEHRARCSLEKVISARVTADEFYMAPELRACDIDGESLLYDFCAATGITSMLRKRLDGIETSAGIDPPQPFVVAGELALLDGHVALHMRGFVRPDDLRVAMMHRLRGISAVAFDEFHKVEFALSLSLEV